MITDPRLLPPKAHPFPDVVADKRRRIRDHHAAPLNALVQEINAGRDAKPVLLGGRGSARLGRSGA